jgi:hypothetical protein
MKNAARALASRGPNTGFQDDATAEPFEAALEVGDRSGLTELKGSADAIGIHLQSLGLPNQLTDMSPYGATLAALVVSHRRRRRAARPAAEVAAATPGRTGPAAPPEPRL